MHQTETAHCASERYNTPGFTWLWHDVTCLRFGLCLSAVVWSLATADPRSCRVCYWFFCALLHLFAQVRLRDDAGLASLLREVLVESNSAAKTQYRSRYREKGVSTVARRALRRRTSIPMSLVRREPPADAGGVETPAGIGALPREPPLSVTAAHHEGTEVPQSLNPLLLPSESNPHEGHPPSSGQVATSARCSESCSATEREMDASSETSSTVQVQAACREDPKESSSLSHTQGRSCKRICLPSAEDATLSAAGSEGSVTSCSVRLAGGSQYTAGPASVLAEKSAGHGTKGSRRRAHAGVLCEETGGYSHLIRDRDREAEDTEGKQEVAPSDRRLAGVPLETLPGDAARDPPSPPAGVELVVQVVSVWRQYLHFAYNLSKIFAPVDGMQNMHLVQKLQTTQPNSQQLHLWATNLPFHQSAAAARDFASPFRPLCPNNATLSRLPRHAEMPRSLTKGQSLQEGKCATASEGTMTDLPSLTETLGAAELAAETQDDFAQSAGSPAAEPQTAGKANVGYVERDKTRASQKGSQGRGIHEEALKSKVTEGVDDAEPMDPSQRIIQHGPSEQHLAASPCRRNLSRMAKKRVAKKDPTTTNTSAGTDDPRGSGSPTVDSIAALVALSLVGESAPAGAPSKIGKKWKERQDGERLRGRRVLSRRDSEEGLGAEDEGSNRTGGVPGGGTRSDGKERPSISVAAAAAAAAGMQEAAVPLSVAALRIFQTVVGYTATRACSPSIRGSVLLIPGP